MLSRDEARLFRSLTAAQQRDIIAGMTAAELLEMDADFELYAHDDQHPPETDGWRVWLMMAGRGFGKTRAGAEWIHRLAGMRGQRIALVAASIDEARSVMVEGASGLLAVARKHRSPVKWEPSLKQITWTTSGSIAQLYSGDHADGLRGPEHGFAWFDEVEAPVDNSVHGFRVRVSRGGNFLEDDVPSPMTSLTPLEISGLGTGPVTIEVRQIGALATSRPATITINA